MQKLCLCLFHLTHEINERALGCLAFHTHDNGREFQALTTFARAAISAASLLSPSGRRAAPATATVRATCSGLRPDTLHTCSSGLQASSTKSRLGQPEQPVPSSDLGTHHCGSKESMPPSYLAGGAVAAQRCRQCSNPPRRAGRVRSGRCSGKRKRYCGQHCGASGPAAGTGGVATSTARLASGRAGRARENLGRQEAWAEGTPRRTPRFASGETWRLMPGSCVVLLNKCRNS